MLALDAQMARFQPYLPLSRQELEARWARAGGPEKELLGKLGIGRQGVQGWGAVQMYHRLMPAQRLALMNGEKLEFSLHAPQPDRRLPAEWRLPLFQNNATMTFSRYAGTRTAGSL